MHPGGSEWISVLKGCDITEQFEVHHIDTEKAEKILEKYFVREAAKPRIYKFTYNEDGFYRTLKRKVALKMKTIDKSPIQSSKLISDVVLGSVFATSILAVKFNNIYLMMLAGLVLFFMLTISHNFFHKRDNWRMYTFNLSSINYRTVRVIHAMSHHLYPNTYFDMEVSKIEPILQWIPRKKSNFVKIGSCLVSPLIWLILIPHEFVRT